MSDEIRVDQDRVDFLLYAYFGGGGDAFALAGRRAYRDLCRTLRFHGGSGLDQREHVIALLREQIGSLLACHAMTQEDYDAWHRGVCGDLVAYYKTQNIAFTVGHAQKWVNMTMKYLYIHGGVDVTAVFDFLHVPVDSYIFSAVEQQLGMKRPCSAWSKLADYETYLRYQKNIRARLEMPPLRWEFSNWLKTAKERKSYD